MIECVPNFSEGRDWKIIEAIAGVLKKFSGIRLMNYSGDDDHNRSVFTFLGNQEDIVEAALRASDKALDLIDMRAQTGVHPRLGAVDVVPFVPLGRTKMEEAIDAAHLFGRQFYERFGVPVYYYGFAALNSGRRELAHVRRGGYEKLAEKLSNACDAPDVGKPVWQPRSGATAVGARDVLVAFNINLKSDDLCLAQKIASLIREKNGGLRSVRAIGVVLESRHLAQVSINLLQCRETPLQAIYDRVEALSSEHGVEILESELIGLAPKCAFSGTTPEKLKLTGFDSSCLLETHLQDMEILENTKCFC